MDRRAVLAVALGAVAVVVLAAVATSGTVRYAEAPPVFVEPRPLDERAPEPIVADGDVDTVGERGEPRLSPVFETIARIVLSTIVAVAVVLAVAKLWRERPALGWRRRRRADEPFDELADVADAVTADAAAQHAALRRGVPRDGIVECWLRLEATVTGAGIERRPADTSTELVERVLGGSHVDASALAELAALYREARFSSHTMPETARAAAISALDTVHDGLARSARVAT